MTQQQVNKVLVRATTIGYLLCIYPKQCEDKTPEQQCRATYSCNQKAFPFTLALPNGSETTLWLRESDLKLIEIYGLEDYLRMCC